MRGSLRGVGAVRGCGGGSGGGCGGGRGRGGGWIERTVYGLRSVNVTTNSLR